VDSNSVQDTAAVERLIEHYLEMRRFDKVLELVGNQLAEEPEGSRWHYLMGATLYHVDRYDDAEQHLHRAMVLGFDAASVYEMLGHLLHETKRLVEAEQAFLEVLRLNPNHARVHGAYAALLKKTGHNRKADELMKEALRLDPDDPEVLRYRYMFGIAKSDRAEQIEAIERYMQAADSEVSIQMQLGLGALFRNDTRVAREHFREAFLMDPTNKQLADLMVSMDQVQHVLHAPIRWVDRIGGPVVVWIAGVGSILGTQALGWPKVSIVLGIVYITFVVYSWVATPLVKLIMKLRG
jgi:tetratricopeptide (TPR) repeat protein